MDSLRSKLVTIEVSVHDLPGGSIQVPLRDAPRAAAVEVPMPVDPAADLPRYFALRGPNGKYLGYVRDHRYHGFLSFRYDDLASPYVKQEVVRTENGEAHVKCCYNDKFWRKNSPEEEWIVAAADSPNADRSSWSSTLFRANISKSHSGKISLSSLQGNGKGKAYKNNNQIEGCLFASGEAHLRQDAVAYEAVSLVKLPRFVAFKADNDLYVSSFNFLPPPCLRVEFLTPVSDDIGNDSVRHEVEEISEGYIWIKISSMNKYWNVHQDSLKILADGHPATSTQFLPVQVGAASIGLRAGQGNFAATREAIIAAVANSLEKSAIFKVEECVKIRRVSSVKYDMSTAHIYDMQPMVLASSTATNNNNKSSTVALVFSYTNRKSQSWSNSVSFTTGVSFELSGGVPLVTDMSVTLSAEISTTTEWGKTLEQEMNVSATYSVEVGPNEEVKVDMVATQGKCNLQFSYIQEDLLTSGETVRFTKTDGVFKGVNYTNIQYVANPIKRMNQATVKTIMSSL